MRVLIGSTQKMGTGRCYLASEDFGRLWQQYSTHSEKVWPMKRLDEYVKTAEAARILGISQNTLRAWAESGKIPMRRNPANGYRLFLRNDLDRFLAKVSRPAKN